MFCHWVRELFMVHPVSLSPLDWTIIIGYLLFAIGVGVFYAKRAGKSPEEYYLAGRTLPWWVLGTSMVATTFAADTPLAITEMVRSKGIWENWFWWNWLLYGLLAVFLFARLWRRANVLTENELLEIRYSGKPAAFLRAFKAGYFAIVFNFIVMGWVITGMSSILAIMLGSEQDVMIWILAIIAVVYALLSGFWGVVVTDLVQFVIAVVGSVILAVAAVNHVGGLESMMEQVQAVADANAKPDMLSFVPAMPEAGLSFVDYIQTPFFQFLVLVLIMWWSNHSADGGGYIAQRIMAGKNERHALAGTLWYNFANYALRSWPWIIVALASIIMFPDLSGQEMGDKSGYPLVMKEVLGNGGRGLLLVSFLAAFMSTIDTHLNWGSSYLVHDIWRRFVKPDSGFANQDAANLHYVRASRVATVGLMLGAALVATQMQSIEKAWKFVMAMSAGIGLVLILRWFWWRINAWTEIAALTTSVGITFAFEAIAFSQTKAKGEAYQLFGNDPVLFDIPFAFHLQLLVIVFASIACWLIVTYLTKPEPQQTLENFYKLVQPGGWWGPAQAVIPQTKQSVLPGFIGNFFAGMAFVWGSMFVIGYALFFNWMAAGISLVVAALGFWWIWTRCLSLIDE